MNTFIIKLKSSIRQGVYLFFASLLLVAFAACNKSGGGEEEGHDEHEHGGEAPGGSRVELSNAQYKQLNIQLAELSQRNLTATLKVTGVLEVPPQNKADVTSPLGGTVQQILVKEGDRVSKGQTLLTLTNPEFVRLQQDYLDTRSQLTFAETEYNRQKELAEKNVTAKKTFQQATSTYNSLQAQLSGLRQQLNLLNVSASQLSHENIATSISVRSPTSGTVSNIEVTLGTTVEASSDLMDVVDNNQVHADLFVYEQDLAQVKEGQMVEIAMVNSPGRTYTAKVFSVGSAFETGTKTITVHANIVGDKTGLIDGMSITGSIGTASDSTTAVPNTAITNSSGMDYIFVQTSTEEHAAHTEEAGHGEAAHDHDAHAHDEHGHDEHGHEHSDAKATKHDAGHGEPEHKHTDDGHDHAAETKTPTKAKANEEAAGDEEDEHGDHHAEGEKKADYAFVKIQVKRGATDGTYTQITPLQPLPENAKVVTNGAFYLMSMLTNAGEGHSH